MTPGPRLRALCPLGFEAVAIRRGAPGAQVLRVGAGPAKARAAAPKLATWASPGEPVVVAGVGGGLGHGLRPGDLLVAAQVRGPDGIFDLPGADMLAAGLRRAGLSARAGTIVSTPSVVHGLARARLAATGADVADMESAWLLEGLDERPRAVVRAVADTPSTGMAGLAAAGLTALRSLQAAAPVLAEWAAACRPRSVVLASPRSYCAGVERAIEVVERALDRFGSPVYVRRQIVHNRHVVEALEERGAVFVEELDAVPDGATVVFSAHGVAPAVRRAAGERGLRVVDATCPLVAKVHTEARRFAAKGYELVLIGHAGHDEVEGTLGENAGIRLVETAQDVARLELRPEDRVAYLTQTTLAVDEVEMIVGSLRERWPELAGPAADDVCYATQNRQDALRAIAGAVDLVVVVSSPNSSNGNRLAEVARRMGARAELVDDASEIDLRWLGDAGSVAVTAAASAPESVVRGVVDALGSLGRLELSEHPVTTEKIRFPLPLEVR